MYLADILGKLITIGFIGIIMWAIGLMWDETKRKIIDRVFIIIAVIIGLTAVAAIICSVSQYNPYLCITC